MNWLKSNVLRDKIMQAKDRAAERVTIPEWDNLEVYVRPMSARDRDLWEGSELELRKANDDEVLVENMRARLVVRMAVDAEGTLVFSPEDAEALGEKSAAAVSRIYDVATRLNGLTIADVAELEKN